MIKLKPIAEQIILTEAEETITWGDVQKFFDAMLQAQQTSGAKGLAKDAGKTVLKKVGLAGAKWAANLVTGGTASVVLDLVADFTSETGGVLDPASIGKALLHSLCSAHHLKVLTKKYLPTSHPFPEPLQHLVG